MSLLPIAEHSPAELYDASLRWTVKSRKDTDCTYVVELGAAPGYSACSCRDFEIHFLPLLKRGVTPEEALRSGLVKLRDYHDGPADSLSCYHIISAERALAKATIRSLVKARDLGTPK